MTIVHWKSLIIYDIGYTGSYLNFFFDVLVRVAAIVSVIVRKVKTEFELFVCGLQCVCEKRELFSGANFFLKLVLKSGKYSARCL